MAHQSTHPKTMQFIRELCQGKSEEELQEAQQNFLEYLLIVKEMCDRLEREGIDISSFDEEPDVA